MLEDKINIQSSDPRLNSKISTRTIDPDEPVYWYLKFNLPLDPSSVSEDSMYVTDLGGFRMETYIEYNKKNHVITISPLMTYEKNYYYILQISTNVRSASGNNLKRQINLLFKINDDEKVDEFKPLSKEQPAPIVQDRPKNYDPHKVKSKLYGIDQDVKESAKSGVLRAKPLKIDPTYAIIGILILIGTVFSNIPLFIGFGLAIAIYGAFTLTKQIVSSEKRSILAYNKGARFFNKEEYKKAELYFKKAYALDEYNESAEYAIEKIQYYK